MSAFCDLSDRDNSCLPLLVLYAISQTFCLVSMFLQLHNQCYSFLVVKV